MVIFHSYVSLPEGNPGGPSGHNPPRSPMVPKSPGPGGLQKGRLIGASDGTKILGTSADPFIEPVQQWFVSAFMQMVQHAELQRNQKPFCFSSKSNPTIQCSPSTFLQTKALRMKYGTLTGQKWSEANPPSPNSIR